MCPESVTLRVGIRRILRTVSGTYDAPLKQIRQALDHAVEVSGLGAIPSMQEQLGDVTDAVLEGAARFAGEVLSPLNPVAIARRHVARRKG